jgi:hypothetical protein
MAHLVRAGQTLLRQVTEHRDDLTFVPGDLDGIGRYRSVDFDAKTSKWLRPLLEACADPRIKELDKAPKSHLVVRFVDTIKADDPTPFALDEADAIING